ncbi:type I methionyl aminopeptidase [Candidatus Uhrbacteria bacterium]|nr:type I methionyl aminopeptidase [Candidatus Uhrbacteria bacterium]
MALVKTSEEIDKMRRGGLLLSRALQAAIAEVRPGIGIWELDMVAERVIRDGGGTPSFKGYRVFPDDIPFPSTVCISVNAEVVHGPGNRRMTLREGDIIGLDIGCWFEGLCTDMAVTVPVGRVSDKVVKLMGVTKESLLAGVAAARPGAFVKDIGRAVQDVIQPHRYGIVRALAGHGVGHAVHEEPQVPNFADPRSPRVALKEGMCLAIEPMISMGGDERVTTADDGWTVVMRDGSLAAHFEVTIVLTAAGNEIVTPLPV